jgi:tetratricopeptide (TPR) repeat protein
LCLGSVINPHFSGAQEPADSIFIVLRSPLSDSVKAKKINALFYRMLVTGKYEEMIQLADSMGAMAEKKGLVYCRASAIYTKGRVLSEKGDYPGSIRHLKEAVAIYEKINDQTGIANSYSGLGQTYVEQGNTTEALKCYFIALKILAKADDQPGIATCYNNLGNLYLTQGSGEDALKNYFESIRIREEIHDRPGMSASLNNIGNIYYGRKEYDKALEYYGKALAINKEFGRKRWISNNYLGIGSVYEELKEYDKALDNYRIALKIKSEIGDMNGIAAAYTSIGDVWLARRDFPKAKIYLDSALKIATGIGNIRMVQGTYDGLMKLSYARGDYKSAYDYYELFSAAKDSLINEENLKTVALMRSQFDMERKENEIKLLNTKNEVQAERARAESNRQKIILFSVIGILLLVGLFSLLIYHRWRFSLRQKQVIEKQQKNILDSIRYAKHIQQSVLPGEEKVRETIPFESFLLFQPKDIVSGDFYWVSSVKQNGIEKYIVAAADCTGHGVPGAFLTMMGTMVLKEVIGKNILDPALILGYIHREVTETLSRGKEMDGLGDGMDISVCIIDPGALTLSYAGAMLPVIVCSPGKNKTLTLKPDSYSIGGMVKNSGAPSVAFTRQEIQLEKGSCIYLFSDGYADQFSKETRKRFGTKQFGQLLEKNAQRPMSEQKEILMKTFNDWKGNSHQLDDLLVIGIRV